jgi:hypothetical protein
MRVVSYGIYACKFCTYPSEACYKILGLSCILKIPSVKNKNPGLPEANRDGHKNIHAISGMAGTIHFKD